jgi:UDP-N-acetylmuramate dehydrogenase
MTIDPKSLDVLREIFGAKLQENVRLSNYTTLNLGGPADALMIAHSADQLAHMVSNLWELDLPFYVMGSGSNLLISDDGLRAVVVINRAHNIKVNTRTRPFTVWAESGALMVNIGKKLILRGLSGMEWAATIPGTVGGAIYGNAGAFGNEICGQLISADIIHRDFGRESWKCERLDYTYRASMIKRDDEPAVILSGLFHVHKGDPDQIRIEINNLRSKRASKQPPGASVGSVFRNPPGSSAGKLIEDAGLKGKIIGGAIISPKHANFIINQGDATAQDVLNLILVAKDTVKKESGIDLLPEIELVGNWNKLPAHLKTIRKQLVEKK